MWTKIRMFTQNQIIKYAPVNMQEKAMFSIKLMNVLGLNDNDVSGGSGRKRVYCKHVIMLLKWHIE